MERAVPMRTVILVPWRSDEGPRERAWAVCWQRWANLFPDWAIYEGVSPPGPFQRSAAINHAARQAKDWDVALIIDADVMLSARNVKEAVKRAAKTGKVTWPHRRWRQINEEATERLVGQHGAKVAEGMLGPGGYLAAEFTADLDLIVNKTTALSWSCCIAIRRDAWDRIGGFDERFIGWGHEDGAFMAAAGALVGWDRLEGDVLNLWHPRTPGAGVADKTGPKKYTAQALVNGRLGMRYAIALRRDHGLTDRPERSLAEVLERDIANLMRYDREFAEQQKPDERARWDDWWPTIEELVASAKQHHVGSVTVVMTSGGTAETWPARSGYLRQALASLTEHVSGPIIQRVVYSDWPEEFKAGVEEIAGEFGFYVVGGPHVGYTEMRKRLWKYIARRATGTHIFAVEDDFEFTRPVDLVPMMATLTAEPHLTQIALLRNGYPDEIECGGVLGWPLPAFTFRDGWFEHRQFWTANPSLFPRTLTDTPWPDGHHSETIFGKRVLADKRARSAFWGDGSEWIHHLGAVRAGVGY